MQRQSKFIRVSILLFFVLDDVPVPSGGPFVLCDYGAADGGASHDLIANVIGKEQLQKQRRSNVCEIPR